MEVSTLELRRFHPIQIPAINMILKESLYIQLEDNQLLYKEGDDVGTFYIIIQGKLVLHSKSIGAIGLCHVNDQTTCFVGEEELVYQGEKRKSKAKKRTESVYSDGPTDVIEITISGWNNIKSIITKKDF